MNLQTTFRIRYIILSAYKVIELVLNKSNNNLHLFNLHNFLITVTSNHQNSDFIQIL